MRTPNNPNWELVMKKANEFLISSETIDSFPFSINKVLKEYSNIVCRTFAKAAQKYNIPIEEFGSDSAIITRKLGRTIIFYNSNKPKAHIRFSILHEFGHEILEHELSDNDAKDYGTKEVETNFFTAQVLMPEQLIREFQIRGVSISESFLMTTFGVSREAARKRRSTLSKINWDWRSSQENGSNDEAILKKYAPFLDSVKPRSFDSLDYMENEYELENERNNWR